MEFPDGDRRVWMISLLLCAVEKVLSTPYMDSVKRVSGGRLLVNDQRRVHVRDGFRKQCSDCAVKV